MYTVLNAVLDHSCQVEHKLSYIELSKQLPIKQSIASQSSQQLVVKVKNELSSSKTRFDALLLLSAFINGRDDAFTDCDNLLFWSQTCLKQIQQSNDRQINLICYQLLGKILEISVSFDSSLNSQFLREMSSTVVPQLIDLIISKANTNLTEVLLCLKACISSFPRSFASKRSSVENVLISNVSTICDLNNLKILALCYSKLALCTVSGPQNTNIQNLWKDYMIRSLITMNSLLNIYRITGKDTSFLDYSLKSNTLHAIFTDDNYDVISSPIETINRIHFISLVICSLLTATFPCVVSVPANAIIEMVRKMSFININDIHSNNSAIDVNAIIFIIPNIHEMAFNILEALLLSCKSALIVHSNSINKIALNSLEWSKNSNEVYVKPYSSLRRRIYCFIEKWCSLIGINSNLSTCDIKHLSDHLIVDIKPAEIILRLRNKSSDKEPNNVENQVNIVKPDSYKLCFTALKAFKSLIYSYGSIMDENNQRIVHKEIFNLALLINRSRNNPPKPYEREECRKELLNVLFSSILNSNTLLASSLGLVAVIFSDAERLDESIVVKQFCSETIVTLNFLIHSKLKVCSTNLSHVFNENNESEVNSVKEIEASNNESNDLIALKEPLIEAQLNASDSVHLIEDIEADKSLQECITIDESNDQQIYFESDYKDTEDDNECIIVEETSNCFKDANDVNIDARDNESNADIEDSMIDMTVVKERQTEDLTAKRALTPEDDDNDHHLCASKKLRDSTDEKVLNMIKDFVDS